MPYKPRYPCVTCEVEVEEFTSLWFSTPIGMTCVHTCRTQECAKPAVREREEQGWTFRREGPPVSTKEKMKADAKRK